MRRDVLQRADEHLVARSADACRTCWCGCWSPNSCIARHRCSPTIRTTAPDPAYPSPGLRGIAMRRIEFACWLAMSWAAHAAKPAEPVQVDFGAGAWVDVDATGKAHVVEMDRFDPVSRTTANPDPLRTIIKARLRERIETWQFQPADQERRRLLRAGPHITCKLSELDDGVGCIRLAHRSAATGADLADATERYS